MKVGVCHRMVDATATSAPLATYRDGTEAMISYDSQGKGWESKDWRAKASECAIHARGHRPAPADLQGIVTI